MARPKREVIQPEDKYVIRFPDGMRDQLKEAAKENNRSLNAEIIARLEAYEQMRINSKQVDKAKYEELDKIIYKVHQLSEMIKAELIEQARKRSEDKGDN